MGHARVLWASMRKRSYPLEQVLQLRVRTYQEAELELARARGRLHDAQLALTAAQEALAAHSAKRARVVNPEPAGKVVSSQALVWSGAYAARLQVDALKLKERVKAAQEVVTAEARALRLAELTWHRAYADREMLNRHHERFLESERKAAERAEELEIEDLWHPAHRPHVRT
jgi:hypothetical protein